MLTCLVVAMTVDDASDINFAAKKLNNSKTEMFHTHLRPDSTGDQYNHHSLNAGTQD